MARPLRIEFPDAIYHVTSRGDRREPIFVDDADRSSLLAIVAKGLDRFNAQVLAYCLMGNHYHFVLRTSEPNLSRLMRHINGVYTQAFNRRHAQVGHLFQGRFKAILVDRDAYLLAVCRYVELNPVRAGMVTEPSAWPWSSYRAHAGLSRAPAWLDTATVYGCLLGADARGAMDFRRGADRYAALVRAAPAMPLWDRALRQQIYLGDDAFIASMQARADPRRAVSREVPGRQRGKPITLTQWLDVCDTRDEALWRAHTESGLSMSALALALGLSVSRVSRLISGAEKNRRRDECGDGNAVRAKGKT
jgi:REP element-mobilizing transposase RayT